MNPLARSFSSIVLTSAFRHPSYHFEPLSKQDRKEVRAQKRKRALKDDKPRSKPRFGSRDTNRPRRSSYVERKRRRRTSPTPSRKAAADAQQHTRAQTTHRAPRLSHAQTSWPRKTPLRARSCMEQKPSWPSPQPRRNSSNSRKILPLPTAGT